MNLKSITELFNSDINKRILTSLYGVIMDTNSFYESATMDAFSDDYNENLDILDGIAFSEYVDEDKDNSIHISKAITDNLHRVLSVLQADDDEFTIATINMNDKYCGVLNLITALYIVEVKSCMGNLLDGLISYGIKEVLCDQALITLKNEIANEDYTSIYELFESCDNEVLNNYVSGCSEL